MHRLAPVLGLLLFGCGGSTAAAPSADPEPVEEPVAAATELELPDEVSVEPTALWSEVVAAEDRSEADSALDEGRRPAEVFSFFGIERGQRVADLFAGTGYSTELLARAVGPEGQVYAQNNAFVMDRFARAPLTERLAQEHLSHVVLVEREMDSPIPPEARELDAVTFVLAYHDTGWMETDRAAMNQAVFEALRSGGVYGIVDHAAAAGAGISQGQTLHRVEEELVVREVTAAGFVLDARASTLRNPEDPLDWNAAPSAAGERRGTSDRFVLRFVKP